MPHRTFIDTKGAKWEVWEVVPSAVERRMSGTQEAPADLTEERRQRDEPRVLVPAELQHGWLAFQSGDARRRLAPVPQNWVTMTERELAELLARAISRPGSNHHD